MGIKANFSLGFSGCFWSSWYLGAKRETKDAWDIFCSMCLSFLGCSRLFCCLRPGTAFYDLPLT